VVAPFWGAAVKSVIWLVPLAVRVPLALLDELYIDRHCEPLLYSARLDPGGVGVSGPENDFEEPEGVVAFEANHAPTRKAQRRQDAAFDHFEPSRRTWVEHSTDVVLDELSNFGLVVARRRWSSPSNSPGPTSTPSPAPSPSRSERWAGRSPPWPKPAT
jgi:hypothetical protein